MWWDAPGVASLVAFVWLLTLAPSDYAGRAYAAYGGVYIVARCFSYGWPSIARRTAGTLRARRWPSSVRP